MFFTDRGPGYWLVLSAATSGAGKLKDIEANSINTGGDRCVERKLLRMCQNVVHFFKPSLTE